MSKNQPKTEYERRLRQTEQWVREETERMLQHNLLIGDQIRKSQEWIATRRSNWRRQEWIGDVHR